jgi:hypothetical protein
MKEGFIFNKTIEGFDFVDPGLNAIQSIADGLNIGLSIVEMVQGIFSSIMNILNMGMQIAASILRAFMIAVQMFAAVLQTILFALGVAMAISGIIMVVIGGKSWLRGYSNHLNCAGLEFISGWKNTGTVFDVLSTCSWYKFKNFLNGSCTRYYIVDMVLGLLYGIFIELPLILINAIFGINLAPLVLMIWNLFMLPLDALFYALSGFHLIQWPDSVIHKCYRCEGKWTFKNGTTVTIYKTFGEWAQLLNCSGDQILQGINHIFTTMLPSSRWSEWFNKRHLPGSDWEPAFWGIQSPPSSPPPNQYSTAFTGVDNIAKEGSN